MDNIEKMDLSDELDGSTPIDQLSPAEEKPLEKNVNKTIKMDSTPINDVMSGPADWDTQSQMGSPPAQQYQVPVTQHAPSHQAPPAKQNPMNLTDEQMTALLVGVAAAIASSKMVQEKLASMIPQVGSDPQGMFAVAVTGLVAALLFYFGKRFFM
jgi:hypothetical protein